MTIPERLQKILDTENLSPSQFADEIGVQRSSLSHILSGRNNPSFDYLLKIMNRFTNLDANWILTGRGDMYKADNKKDNSIPDAEKPANNPKKDLFMGILKDEAQAPYYTSVPHSKEQHKMREDNISVNQKDIKKIVEFYSDDTFAVFYPSSEKT